MPHTIVTYNPSSITSTCPKQTIFAKKSVARWQERSPGKRGQVRWIGDEETASGRFDSEAENKKAFLIFCSTFVSI